MATETREVSFLQEVAELVEQVDAGRVDGLDADVAGGPPPEASAPEVFGMAGGIFVEAAGVLELRDAALEAVVAGEDLAGLGQEDFAGGGEGQGSDGAVDEGDAELAFQGADALAGGGLGQVVVGGRQGRKLWRRATSQNRAEVSMAGEMVALAGMMSRDLLLDNLIIRAGRGAFRGAWGVGFKPIGHGRMPGLAEPRHGSARAFGAWRRWTGGLPEHHGGGVALGPLAARQGHLADALEDADGQVHLEVEEAGAFGYGGGGEVGGGGGACCRR